eukprot:20192-Heterococcus_DN1.PRE.7
MELFYPKAKPGAGFFIEAGGLDEGNPSNFELLKLNRPNTINIGEAICAEGMNTVTFSAKPGAVAGDVTQMSKEFHKQWDQENGNKTVTVPCRPLSAMLKQHGVTHIDFFSASFSMLAVRCATVVLMVHSLDVEGAELTVLKTIDFSNVHIEVLIWEKDLP